MGHRTRGIGGPIWAAATSWQTAGHVREKAHFPCSKWEGLRRATVSGGGSVERLKATPLSST